jgi:hypothetical protein
MKTLRVRVPVIDTHLSARYLILGIRHVLGHFKLVLLHIKLRPCAVLVPELASDDQGCGRQSVLKAQLLHLNLLHLKLHHVELLLELVVGGVV